MILVTGADGFLGSHLHKGLATRGHTVVGFDREYGDLTDAGVVAEMFELYRPEIVVHMAAQVGRQFCEDDAGHAINSNVTMTYHVATNCAKHKAQMVYTSTSEVYGEHGDTTVDEDTPLIAKPTGMYALTKRWAEDVVAAYAPRGYRILRPSMPYGPGAPPGRGRRALDNFLWQAHHQMPMTVHTGAERSWCYIDDAVDAMARVIGEGKPGAYNVGRSDASVSMRRVAEMACDMAGAPRSLIEMTIPPPRQTVVKRLSDDKLRALGWAPKVELPEGMARVYDWIQRFDKDGNYVGDHVGRSRADEDNAVRHAA